MSLPDSTEPTSLPTPARVIELWTPRAIFWLGVFLGWPTALVLCVINWFRMGQTKKALAFTGGGLVGLVLFLVTSFKMPLDSDRLPLLVLNIFLLIAFQALMVIDFNASGYPNSSFKKAGIGLGILIGILTLAVIFLSLVFIILSIELVKLVLIPA